MMSRRNLLGVTVALATAISCDARAYTHIVKPGETLAQIAARIYGDSKLERVLVGANALDSQGGTVIAPGMHLEIPAPGHHTMRQGETWASLSLAWLGTADSARTDLLATSNKRVPWVPPVEGEEIEIPAVVTYIAGDGETVDGIAQRFWGDPNRGWELNRYNHREGLAVRRGDVVLVPIVGLHLTDAGKSEAITAAERDGTSGGAALERQRKADDDLPRLLADVRYGRYAEAITLGNRLLGGGGLTHPQLATIDRTLVEAYVAIDAASAASAACANWKANEPNPVLDPVRVSPKIREACKSPR
ncbi:MAG: LysM peptidoglycan-binding domain-containing protein [Polyangiaceae bacterium]